MILIQEFTCTLCKVTFREQIAAIISDPPESGERVKVYPNETYPQDTCAEWFGDIYDDGRTCVQRLELQS